MTTIGIPNGGVKPRSKLITVETQHTLCHPDRPMHRSIITATYYLL